MPKIKSMIVNGPVLGSTENPKNKEIYTFIHTNVYIQLTNYLNLSR